MRSIMLKLWLAITLTNLIIFAFLGVFAGKLVHDFHFDLKAQDMRMLGNEVNIIYGKSGKTKALDYALAMATHSSAIVAIVDERGKPITATEKALITGNNILLPQELIAVNKHKPSLNIGDNKLFHKEMISVVIPSPSGHFSTVVFSPVEPITSTINDLIRLILLVGLISMFVMALIAYFISRKISAPLRQLNKEALKIAEGEFDDLQLPKSRDEIGQLSETIYYAAKNLKKTINEREMLYQMQKDFVANVSHDLRTPLSLIQGYAIALQQNIVEGQEKENAINIIIDESERMHRLTNELLELAKLEEGKKEYKRTALRLDELTKKILTQQSNNLKNIELNFEDKTQGAVVFADIDAITQVIINLLSNAINHTPQQGSIAIRIDSLEKQLLFSIQNSGSFISPEDLPFIWERFYKTEKSRNRNYKGTGLGLAIVKAIITAHDGQVGAESSNEKGTTFWFTLNIE